MSARVLLRLTPSGVALLRPAPLPRGIGATLPLMGHAPVLPDGNPTPVHHRPSTRNTILPRVWPV